MIKFEYTQVAGWEASLRGMRNPKNSWAKSDTVFFNENTGYHGCCDNLDITPSSVETFGENDHDLAMRLAKAGSVHAKYRRQLVVWVDITAPLYWWKEFDTYRFGCEKDSCSTMHCIADHEFTLEDFSCEHLGASDVCVTEDPMIGRCGIPYTSRDVLELVIKALNYWRGEYIKADDLCKGFENNMSKRSEYDCWKERRKHCWWQMIQLLPSSYNQKRTLMISYEVLANIYHTGRRNHKLDEWRTFCKWAEELPYSELFTLEEVSE